MHEQLKSEFIQVFAVFATLFVILKIVFINENLFTLLRFAASLFWLFVIPGFCIMLIWREKLDFIERLIMGTVLGLAVFGLVGYNLSAAGFGMNYQVFLLPVLIISASFLALKKSVKV